MFAATVGAQHAASTRPATSATASHPLRGRGAGRRGPDSGPDRADRRLRRGRRPAADARLREPASGSTQLSLVIASHNHADHIGGIAELVRLAPPLYYMDNGVAAATRVQAQVLEAVAAAGSTLLEPIARRITMGDVTLTVVPPPGIPAWDQNDNSIGLVVEYGAFRLSLAGDAEPREWAWWDVHDPAVADAG